MEQVPGMEFVDPGHLVESLRNFDAYVDDVNAGVTEMAWKQFSGNEATSLMETLLKQAEEGLQYYSDLLEMSGGALNPIQCLFT